MSAVTYPREAFPRCRPTPRPPLQAFLVFMVYVYISMAAREGVLLLNGSRIRAWWIWHHYLSAATCIITVTLPVDSPAVGRFVEGWLLWTIAQAALMLAQNQCAPP